METGIRKRIRNGYMMRVIALLSLFAVGYSSTGLSAPYKPLSEYKTELGSLSPKELSDLAVKGTSIDGKNAGDAYSRGYAACNLLCDTHTADADAELKALLQTFGLERILKSMILLSLGARGTKECVAIISDFDAWAKRTSAAPPPFRLDLGAYGGNGELNGEKYLKMLGAITDPNGQKWAMLSYPFSTLWLTRHVKDTEWTFPILAATNVSEPEPGVTFGGGPDVFTITTKPGRSYTINMQEVTKDTDNDGWPDLMERTLGTDPNNPDSDGDGMPDGTDKNPLTPQNKTPDPDRIAIRQAAFTVEIATHWERMPIYLWVRKDSQLLNEPQDFYGYNGPVLWTTEGVVDTPNVTDLHVEMISPGEAHVRLGLSLDMVEERVTRYTVKKLHGHWVVTESCFAQL